MRPGLVASVRRLLLVIGVAFAVLPVGSALADATIGEVGNVDSWVRYDTNGNIAEGAVAFEASALDYVTSGQMTSARVPTSDSNLFQQERSRTAGGEYPLRIAPLSVSTKLAYV